MSDKAYMILDEDMRRVVNFLSTQTDLCHEACQALAISAFSTLCTMYEARCDGDKSKEDTISSVFLAIWSALATPLGVSQEHMTRCLTIACTAILPVIEKVVRK